MSGLNDFLRTRLKTDDAEPFTAESSPPWWQEGVTTEIDSAKYFEYLDLLPPRYMNGDLFAFGEGSGNFTLFFTEDKRYFAHQLSLEDTEAFCRLARVPLHL